MTTVFILKYKTAEIGIYAQKWNLGEWNLEVTWNRNRAKEKKKFKNLKEPILQHYSGLKIDSSTFKLFYYKFLFDYGSLNTTRIQDYEFNYMTF